MRNELRIFLFLSLTVAVVNAQLQQEPFLQTTEGTSITIKCSHANIRTGDFIHFYRQLPGQRPELLAVTAKAPKAVRVPKGRLTVSADRSSSSLWLAEPRRGDAAVYYCAECPDHANDTEH
uniref:Immunoglobulin V-set domain-containing protein n=1 Tax=Junco hyemalis TaxID=40217 RepID=A0A8C5NMJ6_JUNHY